MAAERIAGGEILRRSATLVRAYVEGDGGAVGAVVEGLDHAAEEELRLATGEILRLVVAMVMSRPRAFTPADVVALTDRVAAAGPPHIELAVSEAVRAWAGRDYDQMRDGVGTHALGVHVAAVLAAALALAACGEAPFLELLRTFEEVAGLQG